MQGKRAHKILDPLGEEDWQMILALDWGPQQKRIVELFYQNGNETITLGELVEILRGPNAPVFNHFTLIAKIAGVFSRNNLPFTFGFLPEDYGMSDRMRVRFFKAERV